MGPYCYPEIVLYLSHPFLFRYQAVFSCLLLCSEISNTFSLSLLSTDDFVFYLTVTDLPSSIAVTSTVLLAPVPMKSRFSELPVLPHNTIPSICQPSPTLADSRRCCYFSHIKRIRAKQKPSLSHSPNTTPSFPFLGIKLCEGPHSLRSPI